MAEGAQGVHESAQEDYFAHVRSEIAPLLPQQAETILEVGCSAGGTLKWLKSRYPGSVATGIDGHAPNLPAIQRAADHAVIADLDGPIPDLGRFDLILALDVLEHLRDADAVLRRLVDQHLAPGGSVIVSLPAVSHYSVSLPLLLGRRFPYADAGILDRTHIRFFVEGSCVQLMNAAGLRVADGLLAGLAGRKTRLLNTASGGLLKHWLTKQYIMRGVPDGRAQGPVRWRIAGL
jgi:SAM-dependent methyltransferase